MSPNGTRFPRTPQGVAEVKRLAAATPTKMNEELKKEELRLKKIKDEQDEKIKNGLLKDEDGSGAEAGDDDEWYKMKMGEMQEHMMLLEKVIEDNERRFENERYEGTKKLDLRTI